MKKATNKLIEHKRNVYFKELCLAIDADKDSPEVIECINMLLERKIYVLSLYMYFCKREYTYTNYILNHIPDDLYLQIPILYCSDYIPFDIFMKVLSKPETWTFSIKEFMYVDSEGGLTKLCIDDVFITSCRHNIMVKLSLLPINELTYAHFQNKIPYELLHEDFANNIRYLIAKREPYKANEMFCDYKLEKIFNKI